MGERVQYCGYVCNMEEVKDPQRVREKYELGDEPIVAVMAGGGADAYQLMQAYLDSLQHMETRPRPATIMVTGPFMLEDERKALREWGSAMGVQVRTSVGDSLSPINAADVVVSMAGYNTLSEILRFGKRAVIVPRPGPSAEQGMRARLFEDRGLIHVVPQAELDGRRLARALDRALAEAPRSAGTSPDLTGVANVTRHLLEMLPGGAHTAAERSSALPAVPVIAPPAWNGAEPFRPPSAATG
jgi:predicted glycosyltransferase